MISLGIFLFLWFFGQSNWFLGLKNRRNGPLAKLFLAFFGPFLAFGLTIAAAWAMVISGIIMVGYFVSLLS